MIIIHFQVNSRLKYMRGSRMGVTGRSGHHYIIHIQYTCVHVVREPLLDLGPPRPEKHKGTRVL